MKKIHYSFLLILCFFACKNSNDKHKNNVVSKNTFNLYKEKGRALGTSYNILYFSPYKIEKLKLNLDSIFFDINNSMSTYISNSDISKINRGEVNVVVDKMFKEVFEISKNVYQATGGYFDPTVGQLVNAWGFGPKKLNIKMEPKIVDSLMQYVGFFKLEITPSNTLKKQNPNISLDFNAVAKGYCIDRVAEYFNLKKIDNYLIELGGEVIAKGKHLNKKSLWTVGIDNPNQKNERTLITTLGLNNRAMATSGNYRKFRIDSLTGKKYVHTINALTGYTQESTVLSVSVLAENCAMADAYATAFMAMPLNKTKIVVKNNTNLEVYIVYNNANNRTKTFISEGFKQFLN